MEDRLRRRENESEFEHHKRLVFGKLKDKTLADEDYTELSKYVYGKELSSDTCRRELYGSRYTLELLELDNLQKSQLDESSDELTALKHEYENYEQVKTYKEVVEINKDGTYTSDRLIGIEDENNLKDENFLLNVHKYDPKEWEIVSARNSIWNAQLKGGTVTKLYASKINVKPRVSNISMLEMEEHFNKLKNDYKGYSKPNVKTTNNSDLMLVLPIYDLHYGKKSFKFETGSEIDEKILEERYFAVLKDIISQVKHLKFEKIVYPIGSDMFNSDTIDNTTTRGTRQDNSMRWQELFVEGLELIIKGIDMVSNELKTPVEVFYVMGNHDTMASFYATQYLYAWYRNDKNVEVSRSALARKYIEYGQCLLGFTHGDKEGKRIYSLMQTEQPKAWGRTKYREFFTGHIHHDTVNEQGGVRVRTMSTICGTDAWHYLSGYVGSVEEVRAYVFDKNKGLRQIVNGIFD
jgi:hypothetical protein